MRGATQAYGTGVYRRRILLEGRGGRVRAELEDDFHRFGVELRHDGRRVTAAAARAARFPWTACPGAAVHVEALAGLPLVERAVDLAAHTDPRRHCTHLYDLAALAMAHAAAGRGTRRYDVEVPDRVADRTEARLARDGAPVLAWRLEGHRIAGPGSFAGVSLRGRAFLEWIEAHLDADAAEAALVLRRAVYIALGRATDLDAIPTAARVTPIAGALCHSLQPDVAPGALRMRGSTRDFSRDPEALLGDVPA